MSKTFVSFILLTLIIMFHFSPNSKPDVSPEGSVEALSPTRRQPTDSSSSDEDTLMFAEIDESDLPEHIKEQLREDLKSVDTTVDPKPINKDLAETPGERHLAQQDMMIIEMMENIENDMNDGKSLDWSEEDKIIIENELKKEIQ